MRVQKDLDRIGCYHLKTQQRSLRGVPDIIGCRMGAFFALELKKDSKSKVDELQIYTLKKINREGGFARVTYPEVWEEDLQSLIYFTELQLPAVEDINLRN